MHGLNSAGTAPCSRCGLRTTPNPRDGDGVSNQMCTRCLARSWFEFWSVRGRTKVAPDELALRLENERLSTSGTLLQQNNELLQAS